MQNTFLKYMTERVSISKKRKTDLGPVITISREYGCYGSEIAKLLIDKINAERAKKWNFISNEILHNVASSLRIDPDKITHIFGANKKSTFEDFFSAFAISQRYVCDVNIIKNISKIVTSYANDGNVVIVGRAGCVLAKHIPKALHIRIIAPFDWRVESVSKRFKISTAEGQEKVRGIDEKRHMFMQFFNGDKPDSELFDIVINRATLSTTEIVDMIYDIAVKKGIIQ